MRQLHARLATWSITGALTAVAYGRMIEDVSGVADYLLVGMTGGFVAFVCFLTGALTGIGATENK